MPEQPTYLNRMPRCTCGHHPKDHRAYVDPPSGEIGCTAMVGPHGFPKECACTCIRSDAQARADAKPAIDWEALDIDEEDVPGLLPGGAR